MITVKEAKKGDEYIIIDLIKQLAANQNPDKYVETNVGLLRKAIFKENPDCSFLLAYNKEKAVGYLSFTWNYSIWIGRRHMLLDDLYVNENYRNNRVGEKLMIEAKKICVENRIAIIKWEVEEKNESALRFYNRLGAKSKVKVICKWDFNDSFKN
ncbi:GNAT family N-acetyltransferase [Flavivirga sp. 57AJ16]|uniref:GNAT family N-acetyltransferase n=1 Tax=Flavivirga sp. 57AJ16 TaxID=3025307 RepID=UPI0023654D7C|nr:GNAT family N-acetyltransferase [Flavivirga sp. 57AJ16]MDD7886208.1 GNAT family N-acetyltransferase [Flavivirga sp. 57AJ16]